MAPMSASSSVSPNSNAHTARENILEQEYPPDVRAAVLRAQKSLGDILPGAPNSKPWDDVANNRNKVPSFLQAYFPHQLDLTTCKLEQKERTEMVPNDTMSSATINSTATVVTPSSSTAASSSTTTTASSQAIAIDPPFLSILANPVHALHLSSQGLDRPFASAPCGVPSMMLYGHEHERLAVSRVRGLVPVYIPDSADWRELHQKEERMRKEEEERRREEEAEERIKKENEQKREKNEADVVNVNNEDDKSSSEAVGKVDASARQVEGRSTGEADAGSMDIDDNDKEQKSDSTKPSDENAAIKESSRKEETRIKSIPEHSKSETADTLLNETMNSSKNDVTSSGGASLPFESIDKKEPGIPVVGTMDTTTIASGPETTDGAKHGDESKETADPLQPKELADKCTEATADKKRAFASAGDKEKAADGDKGQGNSSQRPSLQDESHFWSLRSQEAHIGQLRRHFLGKRSTPSGACSSSSSNSSKKKAPNAPAAATTKKRKSSSETKNLQLASLPAWREHGAGAARTMNRKEEQEWYRRQAHVKWQSEVWLEQFRLARQAYWTEQENKRNSNNCFASTSARFGVPDLCRTGDRRKCPLCVDGPNSLFWNCKADAEKALEGDDLMQCLDCGAIGCAPSFVVGRPTCQHSILHFLETDHALGTLLDRYILYLNWNSNVFSSMCIQQRLRVVGKARCIAFPVQTSATMKCLTMSVSELIYMRSFRSWHGRVFRCSDLLMRSSSSMYPSLVFSGKECLPHTPQLSRQRTSVVLERVDGGRNCSKESWMSCLRF